MRSIVVCEHDHPLRFAKNFFGSGFLRGAGPWPQSESRTRMDRLRGDPDRLAGFGALVEKSKSECATRQRLLNRRGSAECIEAGASIKAIKPRFVGFG